MRLDELLKQSNLVLSIRKDSKIINFKLPPNPKMEVIPYYQISLKFKNCSEEYENISLRKDKNDSWNSYSLWEIALDRLDCINSLINTIKGKILISDSVNIIVPDDLENVDLVESCYVL